jgi:hypothetical protein
MNIKDANLIPAGFERDADLSTLFSCTIPTNARAALIQAVDNDINWRDDGTNAAVTSGNGGMLLVAGETFFYVGRLEAFTAIEAVATETAGINISYYK